MDTPWTVLFSNSHRLFRVESLIGLAGPRPRYGQVLLVKANEGMQRMPSEIKDFSDFARCRLKLKSALLLTCSVDSSPNLLTFVWRRAYQRYQGPNGAKVNRKIRNEDETREAVEKIATERGWRVRHVDFSEMSYIAQVTAAAQSSLLVGIHGAGLVNAMYMRPGPPL